MSLDDPEETGAQPPRGRPFAPGNPGRPPGSKNKMTSFAAGLSSEDAAEIMRVGVEMAKAGKERLVKLFIERMLPKHRPVQIDLPGSASLPMRSMPTRLLSRALLEGCFHRAKARQSRRS